MTLPATSVLTLTGAGTNSLRNEFFGAGGATDFNAVLAQARLHKRNRRNDSIPASGAANFNQFYGASRISLASGGSSPLSTFTINSTTGAINVSFSPKTGDFININTGGSGGATIPAGDWTESCTSTAGLQALGVPQCYLESFFTLGGIADLHQLRLVILGGIGGFLGSGQLFYQITQTSTGRVFNLTVDVSLTRSA